MKLYEYEGKSLFRRMGIPLPRGSVAASEEEAVEAAAQIGYPVVAKSQVLRGGRGKAGAIAFADDERELVKKVQELLGKCISDEMVESVLIEEKVSVVSELYVGITIDPQKSFPLLMFSTYGGMDIEEIAEAHPEQLLKMCVDPVNRPRIFHLLDFCSPSGLRGRQLEQVSRVARSLVQCFFTCEAITTEINPLAVDEKGELCALDAKVEIDDSAMFRVRDVLGLKREGKASDPFEEEARRAGVSYVGLDRGNIGLITGGAGLGMASMDMIAAHGGEPANFLDLGGDATPEKTTAALRIVIESPRVEGVFFNAFGGINNCEEMAHGISRVIDELKPSKPIVVKMRGHAQEEGWALLEAREVPVVKFGTTEEAIMLLLELMKKKKRT